MNTPKSLPLRVQDTWQNKDAREGHGLLPQNAKRIWSFKPTTPTWTTQQYHVSKRYLINGSGFCIAWLSMSWVESICYGPRDCLSCLISTLVVEVKQTSLSSSRDESQGLLKNYKEGLPNDTDSCLETDSRTLSLYILLKVRVPGLVACHLVPSISPEVQNALWAQRQEATGPRAWCQTGAQALIPYK